MDAGKTALVVGASRGLGLGLTEELARRGWQVTATVRQGAAPQVEGVTWARLDINDTAGAQAFAEGLRGQVFDLVFINAGVRSPRDKTLDTATEAEICHVFMTNAISPIRLAGRLVGVVRPGTGVLALMTSVLGSISRNEELSIYSASKAALNQLTRGFAARVPAGISVVSMHPGWVRTDMGGAGAPLDVATSARGMADVLERRAGAGGHVFVDYRGETIPW